MKKKELRMENNLNNNDKNKCKGENITALSEKSAVSPSPAPGLIPAIIQDFKTNEVLMLAYMSRESLEKSVQTQTTWFWSRSRKSLWNKGETSGNCQFIKEIRYDCDSDTLLIKVEQIGNACHTGNRTCFFNIIDINDKKSARTLEGLKFSEIQTCSDFEILSELYDTVNRRIEEQAHDSYSYSLHKKGLDEILKKLGEETIEVILASKHQEKRRTISEIADLIYHLTVLLVEKKISFAEISEELLSRKK
jgi:phosphoribosyl-AMP cyclohydrolase / phosphoribosyl-ATP pyrophosphohydrolase